MSKSFGQYMREMRESERKGFGEMNRLRHQRLADLVAFARAKSPYYREELYKRLPENPDLSQLPVTSKAEMMQHFDDWVTDRKVTYDKVHEFVNDPDKIGRTFMGKYKVALTSGATGKPGYFLKETIELLFQRIIQALGLKEGQVKGEGRNGAFVLASVWLYQICYLTNYREGKPLACIKDHLDCARWRIPSG